MQKVISEVYNIVFGVEKAVYGVRKAAFGMRKAVFGVQNSFQSAKALPAACQISFPLGRNFFSWNMSRNFFCEAPKNQMVAPLPVLLSIYAEGTISVLLKMLWRNNSDRIILNNIIHNALAIWMITNQAVSVP